MGSCKIRWTADRSSSGGSGCFPSRFSFLFIVIRTIRPVRTFELNSNTDPLEPGGLLSSAVRTFQPSLYRPWIVGPLISVTFRYTFVTCRTALLNDVTIENSSEMEPGPGPRLDPSKAIVVTRPFTIPVLSIVITVGAYLSRRVESFCSRG